VTIMIRHIVDRDLWAVYAPTGFSWNWRVLRSEVNVHERREWVARDDDGAVVIKFKDLGGSKKLKGWAKQAHAAGWTPPIGWKP
jgi:hypothetical protein